MRLAPIGKTIAFQSQVRAMYARIKLAQVLLAGLGKLHCLAMK
jgi:hypothetical protein